MKFFSKLNLKKKLLFALCLTQNCLYELNNIWLIQSVDPHFNLLKPKPISLFHFEC